MSAPSDHSAADFYVVLCPVAAIGREPKGGARWYGPFASRRVADMLRASALFLGAMAVVPRASPVDDGPVFDPAGDAVGVAESAPPRREERSAATGSARKQISPTPVQGEA